MFKHPKPLIGIIPDYKEGCPNGYSKGDYYALRSNYVEMINKAGGAAVVLPYDYDLIDDYLDSLDGIMVVGGYFDINPKRYGEEIHPTVKLNDIRENFEYELGKKALKKEVPFLGICNGMQLINVLHGGSAIQHIPDEGENFMDHEQSHIEGFDSYDIAYHDVEIEKNSKLFEIVKEEKVKTNSSHHQAARTAGKGLEIVARASDGIVEALENKNHPFCIGVQWHPEFDVTNADKRIFEAFIKAAEKYKEGKK